MTVEDVWPRWIVRQFPDTKITVTRQPNGRTDQPRLEYSQRTVECRASCVCSACNNGWMSDLENYSKPWIEPLVRGESTTLDERAQLGVVAWATKTAMVIEHALGLPDAEIYWSPQERASFRMMPHRPPGDPGDATNVRLAAYSGSRLAAANAGVTELGGVVSRKPVSIGTRATLVLGKLVLQVESHRWKTAAGRPGWWSGPQFGIRAVFIWPIRQQTINWPPAEPLGDEALDAFSLI